MIKSYATIPLAALTAVAVAACGATTTTKTVVRGSSTGSSAPTQMQIGMKAGQDYVRVQQEFVARPGSIPTIVEFAGNFGLWVQGKAVGKVAPGDLKAAGFATDPAPSKPLSTVARQAAADVALHYLAAARSARYGPLDDGYTVAYRGGTIEYRCKGPANPGSDLCKSSDWRAWQRGFGS